MQIFIDTENKKLSIQNQDNTSQFDLYGIEAFDVISHLWLKTSWNQKYSYTFTWLGRPIIQHPEDMIRMQEVIYNLKPDVIVETGVAHGGSLIYYASIIEAMGKGKIIGIDIEIRDPNRKALEAHPLFKYITLIEKDSVAPESIKEVESYIKPDDVVLV